MQLGDSIDDKTVRSIIMGSANSSVSKSSLSDKTVNSILVDSRDKSQMSSPSKSKIILDKTVGSMMCDTQQFSELGLQTINKKEESKDTSKSKTFKGSATMRTIQSLQMSHEI
jgi:predicted thioredoxin/glutaredoxin